MAIKKDLLNPKIKVVVPDVYIKFCYISWSSIDQKMMAQFSTWTSATAEAEGEETLGIIEIDVTPVFPALQQMMYTEIKKLPEFADAIDV